MKLHRLLCPDGPMSEQAAHDSALHEVPADLKAKRCQQIHDNVVVVSGVEGDLLPARLSHRPDDIQSLIAIERRNFNGDDVLNFGKSPPEYVVQNSSTRGRLQIKADQRDNF